MAMDSPDSPALKKQRSEKTELVVKVSPIDGVSVPKAKPKSASEGRFKIIGHVMMALARWTKAINPTYTYGKRPVESPEQVPVLPKALSARVSSDRLPSKTTSGRSISGRASSGRTSSGRPATAGKHHGFKGALLFKPLPKAETQVTA